MMPRFMKDFCQETKEWDTSYIGSQSKFPVMDLDDRLRKLENRVPGPLLSDLEKYPALRAAYIEFKLIERLITNEKS